MKKQVTRILFLSREQLSMIPTNLSQQQVQEGRKEDSPIAPTLNIHKHSCNQARKS